MNLKTYICGTSKRIPRGAVTHVASALGVHWVRARHVILGYETDPVILDRAEKFVARCGDFTHRKPGIKSRVRAQAVLSRFDAGETLAKIGKRFGISGEYVRVIAERNGRKPRREKKSSVRSVDTNQRLTKFSTIR